MDTPSLTPFFGASLESLLVFLVIVVISSVSNWLKQRHAREEEARERLLRPPGKGPVPPMPRGIQSAPGRPGTGADTPRRGPFDLSEELRRLLDGDTAEAKPELESPLRPEPAAPVARRVAVPPLIRRIEPEPLIREDEPLASPAGMLAGTDFAGAGARVQQAGKPVWSTEPLSEADKAYEGARHLQVDARAKMA